MVVQCRGVLESKLIEAICKSFRDTGRGPSKTQSNLLCSCHVSCHSFFLLLHSPHWISLNLKAGSSLRRVDSRSNVRERNYRRASNRRLNIRQHTHLLVIAYHPPEVLEQNEVHTTEPPALVPKYRDIDAIDKSTTDERHPLSSISS